MKQSRDVEPNSGEVMISGKKAAKAPPEYQSKAVTVSIEFSSRVSVQIKSSYYTFEAREKREVPADANLDKEREFLWDTVHGQVDTQAREIIDSTKAGK